jgi:hypothetical protein
MSEPTVEPQPQPDQPPPALDLAAEEERLRRKLEELQKLPNAPPSPKEQLPDAETEQHPAASGEPERRTSGGNGAAGAARTKPVARALRGSVHDRPVNSDRGEVQVELDGKLWILTPTPWASRNIEAAVPWSLTRLLTYAARGDLKLEELATIVLEGMRATGDAQADFEGVCKLVWSEGQGNVAGPVSLFLHNCLTGGRPPAKKKTPSSASPIASG